MGLVVVLLINAFWISAVVITLRKNGGDFR